MKLVCTQENFNKAIFITQNCITKNNNLPILSNILIQTNEGRLKLSATNLEIGITCWVGAKIEKEGAITIPAKTLNGFISRLNPQKIELEAKKEVLNINTKEAKTNIKGIDAKEFPIIPSIKEKPILGLRIKDLKAALAQVVIAAASSETRPELTGVYTHISFKPPFQITFAATDSYRLAEKIIKLTNNIKEANNNGDKEEMSFIIPKNTLNQLARILDEENEDIKISIIPNQISFDFNNINLISRLIDAQYPDYKQIVPKNFKAKTTVNTAELINAVKITGIFTEERNNSIKIAFNRQESVLEISAESGSGDSIVKIKAKIEEKAENESGEPEDKNEKGKEAPPLPQYVFNYKYFLDGLNNISEEETVILTNSASSPVVIKGAKDESFTYIIMPIKF